MHLPPIPLIPFPLRAQAESTSGRRTELIKKSQVLQSPAANSPQVLFICYRIRLDIFIQFLLDS